MPIRIPCSCGATLEALEDDAGALVVCPRCQAELRVPDSEETAPPNGEARSSAPPEGPCIFHPRGGPEDADFFVPAPPEIGPLRSAHTSLAKTMRHKPLGTRLLIGTVLGVGISAVAAVGLLVGARLPADATGVLFVCFTLIITPVTVGLTLYFTRFRHYCGYVGEYGIAHFTCAGSRERVKVRDLFLFDSADDLRVDITHHYHNGAYNGTTYAYSWNDVPGKAVYVLRGTHHHERRQPPAHDKLRFAQAAEEAWSIHLLRRALPEIDSGGTVTFRLRRQNQILFQKGSLELRLNGKVQHFTPDDLAEVRVREGKVALKEPFAREGWFTSTGVHYFSFAELANAQVFLLLLEKLYGVPTQS